MFVGKKLLTSNTESNNFVLITFVILGFFFYIFNSRISTNFMRMKKGRKKNQTKRWNHSYFAQTPNKMFEEEYLNVFMFFFKGSVVNFFLCLYLDR